MELLCVNAKDIKINNIIYFCKELVEGKIYTTKGKPFLDEEGHLCYYIDGIGILFACRFTEALDNSKKEEFIFKKELCLN